MGGEDNKPSFMDNARKNWAAFRLFVWNSEKSEVLGRNGKSWGQIGIFYLIFYTCLALFWALMLFVFLQTVSPDKPTFNSYVNVPGVTLSPKFNNKPVQFDPSKPKTYEAHVKALRVIYNSLHPANMTGEQFDDCENITEIEDGKNCRFNRSVFGNCQPPNFGWDEGKPCLLLSLNRVSEWEPQDYDPSEIPTEVEDVYVPGNIAFYCRNYKGKQEGTVNATIYPPAGIPFTYYPFIGSTNKTERASYVQPYVAVQFALLEEELKIKVECKTFTKGIDPKGGLWDTDYDSMAVYEFEMASMKDEL